MLTLLTLSMLGKNSADDYYIFIKEKKIWHSMHIDALGDYFDEM